jgi:hypothetical protein
MATRTAEETNNFDEEEEDTFEPETWSPMRICKIILLFLTATRRSSSWPLIGVDVSTMMRDNVSHSTKTKENEKFP